MLVTFVSQCDKKAIKRTRMVLDAFADRIGDFTWQTVITQEGLNTVRSMLRRTATKSTAVSCHWLRSRSRSELLWIVGNKTRFNKQGIVPVNTTQKNILHNEWGNNWSYASIIQISSVIAALFHDIGKSTIGFQNKLQSTSFSGDPYRHEWISICLFHDMISDCKTDEEWLKRFSTFANYLKQNSEWLAKVCNSLGNFNKYDFGILPPLAQLITWLIVSHHRMPFYNKKKYCNMDSRKKLQKNSDEWSGNITEFFEFLEPIENWVKNIKYDESTENDFRQIKNFVIKSKTWQKAISRWTLKALKYPEILSLNSNYIANPIILYLSRLSLIFGDHNYSSLSSEDNKGITGDLELKSIIANTDRKTRKPKQALDVHLLGVAKFTARFAHLLPVIAENLPTLNHNKFFIKNTSVDRFKWQNKSYSLAKSIAADSKEKGFFGINMASTGCGKTLANARVMYALLNEKNVRFTIALGLRILTLQTGDALRERMGLDDSELAVLVGGAASKNLYELNRKNDNGINNELSGSESSDKLMDGDVDFEEDIINKDELGTLISDDKIRKLLYAPVVSCTVDHIISASENCRGGKHIVPILRLLSSDLILDEPDDFSQADLPALARLVHLAGLFGSRVILSSATITPDFATGLFKAYKAGRELWNEHLGIKSKDIICAWFDEHKQDQSLCSNGQDFFEYHNKFSYKRSGYLYELPAKRFAEILSVNDVISSDKTELFSALSNKIILGAQKLHSRYHEVCSETKNHVSIGLVRIAHIKSIIALAHSIYQSKNIPTDTKIHLCCYHSRQLLLLRNNIEVKLDRILNRKDNKKIFDHPEIFNELNQNSEIKNHIFIVLASPVAEIGRDHDYDWAIVEPSSMRSIIQLVGRVWRHRYSKLVKQSNILIMNNNIKSLECGNNLGIGESVFVQPGFENKDFLLDTHNISELLTTEQINKIDSTPRIIKPKEMQPKKRLADLEHSVMEKLLNNSELNFVNAFWKNRNNENRATVHLQKLSPFRSDSEYKDEDEFVFIPDDDEFSGYKFCYRETAWEGVDKCSSQNHKIIYEQNIIFENESVIPWLNPTVEEALENIMVQTGETDLRYAALRYCYVILDDNKTKWYFNPYLGFWYD